MAFFYVKGGGTAGATTDNGRATSKRTGTWNASTGDYYDTIADATNVGKTNPPVAGDYIVWSDASTDALTGDTSHLVPDGVIVVTVDDSNQENYQQATTPQINNTSGNGYVLRCAEDLANGGLLKGVYINNGDSMILAPGGTRQMNVECTTVMTSGGTEILTATGIRAGGLEWIDSTFDVFQVDTTSISVPDGGPFAIYGGVVNNFSTQFLAPGNEGSSSFYFGVDMSGCSSGLTLYNGLGASDSNSNAFAYFYRCNLPTSWVMSDANTQHNQMVIVESCDSEYQYEAYGRGGQVSADTGVYHDDDDNLSDGSSKLSYKFVTNANCTYYNPLRLGQMPVQRWLMAENTDAATNGKCRIKFATPTGTTLDTNDIFLFVMYPDSTTNYHRSSVHHIPDGFSSGSALSTQTSKWIGSGADNQYYYDITMTSPGNGLVMAWVGFTAASSTIYLSPQIEFVP